MDNSRLIVAVALSCFSLSACNIGGGGEGTPGTPLADTAAGASRAYDVRDFSGVTVTGPDNVVVTRGDTFAVTATGNDATLDKLVIRIAEGKLEIGRVRSLISLGGGRAATVRVTLPALSDLTVVGSGSVQSNTLTGRRAEVNIVGSGDTIVTNIASEQLTLTVAGSGTLTASGHAERVEANSAGSGNIVAARLSAPRGEVSVAGSGDVAITITQAADISTIGSGDVTVSGGARCERSSLGSGTISCC